MPNLPLPPLRGLGILFSRRPGAGAPGYSDPAPSGREKTPFLSSPHLLQKRPRLRDVGGIPGRRRAGGETFQGLAGQILPAALGGLGAEVPQRVPEVRLEVHRLLPGVQRLVFLAELIEGYTEIVPGERQP